MSGFCPVLSPLEGREPGPSILSTEVFPVSFCPIYAGNMIAPGKRPGIHFRSNRNMVAGRCRSWKGASVSKRGPGEDGWVVCNCSALSGAEWLMAEYGGWVTLGDESSKPPAPNPLKKWRLSGSWMKALAETNLPHQVWTVTVVLGRVTLNGARTIIGPTAHCGRHPSACLAADSTASDGEAFHGLRIYSRTGSPSR